MKKVFITGITGMVGSHLCDYLFEHTDFEIHGLIRWRSPLTNIHGHLENINNKNRVFLHYGDLVDSNSLDIIFDKHQFDYIFHLAAQSYPHTSFSEQNVTYTVNVIGTSNLLTCIRNKNNNAVVHVCSSSEVFGRVPKDKVPIDEENNFHPASPYAISKTGTDLVGRFFAEAYGTKTIITRMFTHTGPRRGDVFAESSFAKQIALIEGGFLSPIIKVGNLDSLRTFADVRDAVRAYFIAVTSNLLAGSYYNIGGEYTCTVGEMLNYLISLSTVKDIRIEIDPDRIRPIDADLQIPNTNKFRNATGWKPEISFEQTMLDLLNYWRERVALEGVQIQR